MHVYMMIKLRPLITMSHLAKFFANPQHVIIITNYVNGPGTAVSWGLLVCVRTIAF